MLFAYRKTVTTFIPFYSCPDRDWVAGKGFPTLAYTRGWTYQSCIKRKLEKKLKTNHIISQKYIDMSKWHAVQLNRINKTTITILWVQNVSFALEKQFIGFLHIYFKKYFKEYTHFVVLWWHAKVRSFVHSTFLHENNTHMKIVCEITYSTYCQ